jgi:hypothetical protein
LSDDIFFSFEVGLNFLIKKYLFLRFKNALKKIKKNYFLNFFKKYILSLGLVAQQDPRRLGLAPQPFSF